MLFAIVKVHIVRRPASASALAVHSPHDAPKFPVPAALAHVECDMNKLVPLELGCDIGLSCWFFVGQRPTFPAAAGKLRICYFVSATAVSGQLSSTRSPISRTFSCAVFAQRRQNRLRRARGGSMLSLNQGYINTINTKSASACQSQGCTSNKTQVRVNLSICLRSLGEKSDGGESGTGVWIAPVL